MVMTHPQHNTRLPSSSLLLSSSFLLFLLTVLPSPTSSLTSSLTTFTPTHLTIEYVSATDFPSFNNLVPVDISAQHSSPPRFGWWATHPTPAATQAAAAVTVVRLGPHNTTSPVWESGKVAGSAPTLTYGGPALLADTVYEWTVQVWDQTGAASQPASARFLTGLAGEALWAGAQWLAIGNNSDMTNQFRTEFSLPTTATSSPITRATAYVVGLGAYTMSVNGVDVAPDDLLAQTVLWQNRTLYDAHDVTEAVLSSSSTGSVCIAVTVGKWWFAKEGDYLYSPPFALPQGPRLLRVVVRIHFQDGSVASVGTTSPSTWKSHTGIVASDDLHVGEVHDARRETIGWREAGYDDSGWTTPDTASGGPYGGSVLTLQAFPRISRDPDTFTPKVTTHPSPNLTVFDLGMEIAGTCDITFPLGPATGTNVTITVGEFLLQPAGTVILSPPLPDRRHGGRESQVNRFVYGDQQPVGRSRTWSPRFYYSGFRYIQVEGLSAGLANASDVRCWQYSSIHADSQVGYLRFPTTSVEGITPEQTTSAATLSLIDAAMKNTARANFYSVPTDCPTREKRGWLGDMQAVHYTLMSAFDMRSLYGKWMTDMKQTSELEGAPNEMAPYYYGPGTNLGGDPAWSAGVCLLLRTYTQRYDDTRAAIASLPVCKNYADHLLAASNASTLVLPGSYPQTHYGDWDALNTDNVPRHIDGIVNSFYSISQYDVLSTLYTKLNDSAGATHYASLAATGRRGFDSAFKHNGTYTDPNTPTSPSAAPSLPNAPPPQQTRLALATVLGLVSPGSPEASAFVKSVETASPGGPHLVSGVTGSAWILPALSAIGRGDLALAVLLNTGFPSYAWDAQWVGTLFELWNGVTLEGAYSGGTLNHIMMAGSLRWMYESLGGIGMGSDGYESVTIAPEIVHDGPVAAVEVGMHTVRGLVECSWETTSTTVSVNATIPFNVRSASVRLPVDGLGGAGKATVSVSGTPVWKGGAFVPGAVVGVTGGKAVDGGAAVVLSTGSGAYAFEVM